MEETLLLGRALMKALEEMQQERLLTDTEIDMVQKQCVESWKLIMGKQRSIHEGIIEQNLVMKCSNDQERERFIQDWNNNNDNSHVLKTTRAVIQSDGEVLGENATIVLYQDDSSSFQIANTNNNNNNNNNNNKKKKKKIKIEKKKKEDEEEEEEEEEISKTNFSN